MKIISLSSKTKYVNYSSVTLLAWKDEDTLDDYNVCPCCGSDEKWESGSGVIRCRVCHPPASMGAVRRIFRVGEVSRELLPVAS